MLRKELVEKRSQQAIIRLEACCIAGPKEK
jgi:hypothetical protein